MSRYLIKLIRGWYRAYALLLYHSFYFVEGFMESKEILRKELLDLRTKLVLTKDVNLKIKLKEQIDSVRKSYTDLLVEEKGLKKRGR